MTLKHVWGVKAPKQGRPEKFKVLCSMCLKWNHLNNENTTKVELTKCHKRLNLWSMYHSVLFWKTALILADNLKSYDCTLQHPYFLTSSI